MRAVLRLLSLFFALCVTGTGLAGCAPSLDNETTLQSMSASGKGGVLMDVRMTGNACLTGTIVVARQEGDEYRSAGTITHLGIVGGFWWGELEPGEYHIVHIECRTGHRTALLGTTFFAPYKKSFGRFEVRAIEIVNIGSLELIEVGFRTVDLAVRGIPVTDLESFRQTYPNLAVHLETRLLELPSPALTGRDLEKYCAASTARNGTVGAPAPAKCVGLYNENVRRLDALDPARPALSQ
jgi:hypothetical protein